tara:strand:+ start:2024 stop:2692 length:669 start_codon:yes stop_codon:yes gene_type:complete
MAVNLNEITKYVKHNNSELKYSLHPVEKFEQPLIIPKRIFDESKIILDVPKEDKSNILKYKEDEIIDLPSFINDFFDLNEHYSYGVHSSNTFIYSVYYSHDNNFKLLSKTEQESFIQDKKIEMLQQLDENKIKNKTKIKAEINKDNYSENALVFLSQNFNNNIIIIDLNKKVYKMDNEFNNDNNSIVIFKSGDHYFPLVNILGEALKNNSCISIMKYYDSLN